MWLWIVDIETNGYKKKTGEMKFMRRTAGYRVLDRRRNEDILEELTVNPVQKKLVQCKQKWLNHVSRMQNIRYQK
jgi:hypothetical protein